MKITIGSLAFTATLYDNHSVQALKKILPITLTMNELNGNEKYGILSSSLPTDASSIGNIQTGDIMLYGNDCLVIFYKNFSTSYSYTPIGRINDTKGLADALGKGNVSIKFEIQ